MMGSKWQRWLREAVAYSDLQSYPASTAKPLADSEQQQYDRFTKALATVDGFDFQHSKLNLERDDRFFNAASPLAFYGGFSFEDKGLLLFGSWGRKWCNLYIKKPFRRSGLLERIFSAVFRTADETSSTLFLEPKPYELETKEEPTMIATVPRSLFHFDTRLESIERLTRRYLELEPRLERIGNGRLRFQPKSNGLDYVRHTV